MIELYDYTMSTAAYKVRLLLGLLGVEYTTRNVEFYPAREHESEWFLEVNPRGDLPVLTDGGVAITDARTILEYVATAYDPGRTWYPARDARRADALARWLSFADALTTTAAAARLHDGFLYDHIDVEAARRGAHELLRVLDEHLWFAHEAGEAWLCPGSDPTIADLACFPDVMVAQEGGIPLAPYRAIRRWTDRIKRLPGFEVMPGIFPI